MESARRRLEGIISDLDMWASPVSSRMIMPGTNPWKCSPNLRLDVLDSGRSPAMQEKHGLLGYMVDCIVVEINSGDISTQGGSCSGAPTRRSLALDESAMPSSLAKRTDVGDQAVWIKASLGLKPGTSVSLFVPFRGGGDGGNAPSRKSVGSTHHYHTDLCAKVLKRLGHGLQHGGDARALCVQWPWFVSERCGRLLVVCPSLVQSVSKST